MAETAAGEPAADVDAERLARALHVTYNGALITWALSGHASLEDAMRADLDEVLRPYRP